MVVMCMTCDGSRKDCTVCQGIGTVLLSKAAEHPDCDVTDHVPNGAVRVEVSYVRRTLLLRSMDGVEHAIASGVLDPKGRAAMMMWFKRAGRVVSLSRSALALRMDKGHYEEIARSGYGSED